MISLEKQHPEVAREFHNGYFVFHKTDRKFFAMAIDQAHEQNNDVIKGDGGAVGLTEDPSALRRWMVAGPEISKFVVGYEAISGSKEAKKGSQHHEQSPTAQKAFFKKVQRLTSVIEEMGDPFSEKSTDLLSLDTKDIADPTAALLVASHLEKGKEQFQTFMDKLKTDSQHFYQPIKRNNKNKHRSNREIRNTATKGGLSTVLPPFHLLPKQRV
ncbi:unnamed protein product [Acanthosepion pharaonis]|uniref:Uncharacterized protein n=1 Tax=Acanthosepion pharaonis TaxID=158019 RepID=A0A812C091_ACAPH|nr:unnamed protein product [Sepia pharaonis]